MYIFWEILSAFDNYLSIQRIFYFHVYYLDQLSIQNPTDERLAHYFVAI